MKKPVLRVTSLVLVLLLTFQLLPLNTLAAEVRHATERGIVAEAYTNLPNVDELGVDDDVDDGTDGSANPEEPEATLEPESEDEDTELPAEDSETPDDTEIPGEDTETPDDKAEQLRFSQLLNTVALYSLLSADDAAFICQRTGLSPADFAALEQAGYSLAVSIYYGTLANQFLCDIETVAAKLPFGSDALREREAQLSFYLTDLNPDLEGTALDVQLRGYLLDGYTFLQIYHAYGINQVYGIPMDSLLTDGGEENPGNFSQAELVVLNRVAEELYLSASALGAALQTAGLTPAALEENLPAIRMAASALNSSQSQVSDTETDELLDSRHFIGAPTVAISGGEKISLNNGSLMLDTAALTLPGRNGLDLVIGHRYSLQDAGKYTPGYEEVAISLYRVIHGFTIYYPCEDGSGFWPDSNSTRTYSVLFSSSREATAFYESHKLNRVGHYDEDGNLYAITEYFAYPPFQDYHVYLKSILNDNPYLTNLYGLGTGWSFLFSSIEETEDCYTIRLRDGSTYQTDGFSTTIRDYELDDMKLRYDQSFSNGSVSSKFCLSYADGTSEYFDADGRLIGIQNRYQDTITLVHSRENGYPRILITDTLGREVLISGQTTETGHVMTVTLPDGGSLSYAVESQDDVSVLRSYTDAGGYQTDYTYAITGYIFNFATESGYDAANPYATLTEVQTPSGGRTQYQYGSHVARFEDQPRMYLATPRIAARQDIDGTDVVNLASYQYASYDSNGKAGSYPKPDSTSTTITRGNCATTYTFNEDGLLTGSEKKTGGVLCATESFTYNDRKQNTAHVLSQRSDAKSGWFRVRTAAEYDVYDNLTAQWSPLASGDTTQTQYRTSYTYDEAYQLPLTVSYQTDADTTVETVNTLSADGKHILSTSTYENNVLQSRTDYTYNAQGQVASERHYHDGFVTYDLVTYGYTGGLLTSETHTGIQNADGLPAAGTPGYPDGTIVLTWIYDALGRVTQRTDGNGNATTYTYDALGNVTQVTNPDGTTVQYLRDYAANTVTVTDENVAQLKYTYTPLGLESQTIDVASGEVLTSRSYDSLSRLSQVTDHAYGSVTTYTYDALDRVLSETVRSGNRILAQTCYAYDDAAGNNTQKVTKTIVGEDDAPSIVTTQYTNAAGFIVQTGQMLDGEEHFTTYTHDYVGNVLTERTARDAALGLDYTRRSEYDYAGRAVKTYNAENQYTTQTYDALGNLTAATDYAGTPTTYAYDALGRQLKKTILIETGKTASSRYTYDANGNVLREEIPCQAVGSTAAWRRTDYQYDSRSRLTAALQYEGDTPASTTSYTYDGVGNPLTVTTGSSTTSYTYNRYGSVLTTTDPLGQTETCTYNDLGKLLCRTDRRGQDTIFSYDALGRITQTQVLSGNTLLDSQSTAYTLTGAVLYEVNSSFAVYHSYDELGRVIESREVAISAAANGVQDDDLPASFTATVTLDPNGGEVAPTTLTLAPGEAYTLPTPTRTGYLFNGWYLGNDYIPMSGASGFLDSCTLTAQWSPISYTLVYDYSYTSPLFGVTEERSMEVSCVYDQDIVIPEVPEQPSQRVFSCWTNGLNHYFFPGETARNLTSIDGGTVTLTAVWQSTGWQTPRTVTLDPNGGTVVQTSITVPVDGIYYLPAPTREDYTFTGWYAGERKISNGSTVESTDPTTLVAHWEQISYTITLDPNGGEVTPTSISVCNGDTYNLPEPTRAGYTFEGWYLGNARIRNGSTVQLEGDCTLLAHWDVICYTVILDGNGGAVEGKPSLTSLELGNFTGLDTITLPPCPFQPPATDLTFKGWSPKRNGRELYAPGEKLQLRDFTPEFGNTLVFYAIWEEPGENPIIPVRPDPPEVMALSARPSYTNTVKEYTYDLAGNQTSFALARGTTLIQSVAYTYDTLGRLSTVVENGTTQASYAYTVNGARASLTYANGASETYAYNLAGWVTNVSNYAGDELLSSFDYTYYADGSQRTKTTLDGTVTTYVYDGLGRLTNESVSGGTSLAYTYDARGNRSTLTATGEAYYSVSYTYDAANRLLSELKNESNVLTSTTYAYDANGNTVSKQQVTDGLTVRSETSTYNAFNQLTAQTLNEAGIVTDLAYEYYPDGIRGVKTVDDVPTVYLVNSGYVVAEYRGNTLTSVYLWGANLIKAGIGDDVFYYLYNAHGDVIQLTNEEGAVTKSYLYDAFGVEDEPSIYDLNPFRYCGEYYDRESGTYYLRARYYNPGTGRFTQEDPHWNPGNMIYGDNENTTPIIGVIMQATALYVYCVNNPVSFYDPSGAWYSGGQWVPPGIFHQAVIDDIVRQHEFIVSEVFIAYGSIQRGSSPYGRADLVDCETGEVWEVKPMSIREISKGIDQVDAYIRGTAYKSSCTFPDTLQYGKQIFYGCVSVPAPKGSDNVYDVYYATFPCQEADNSLIVYLPVPREKKPDEVTEQVVVPVPSPTGVGRAETEPPPVSAAAAAAAAGVASAAAVAAVSCGRGVAGKGTAAFLY